MERMGPCPRESDCPVRCSNFLQFPADCAVTFTVTRKLERVRPKSYCIWIRLLSIISGRFASRSPQKMVDAKLLRHYPTTLAVLAVPAVQRARERHLPGQSSKNSKAPGAERAAEPGDLMQPISPRTTPGSPPQSAAAPLSPTGPAHVRPAARPRPSGPCCRAHNLVHTGKPAWSVSGQHRCAWARVE